MLCHVFEIPDTLDDRTVQFVHYLLKLACGPLGKSFTKTGQREF